MAAEIRGHGCILHDLTVGGQLGGNVNGHAVQMSRRHERERRQVVQAEDGTHVLADILDAPLLVLVGRCLLPEKCGDAILAEISRRFTQVGVDYGVCQ